MSNPYIGEIRIFASNFAPVGWAICDGALMDISTNPTLFNLIGTTYGGNGTTTFALPDLRGRVPVHQGNGQIIGQTGGVETVTLGTPQMGAHAHALGASPQPGTSAAPAGGVLASSTSAMLFAGNDASLVPLAVGAVSSVGGGQPHENMAPFQVINYIISLFGIYPSQS